MNTLEFVEEFQKRIGRSLKDREMGVLGEMLSTYSEKQYKECNKCGHAMNEVLEKNTKLEERIRELTFLLDANE